MQTALVVAVGGMTFDFEPGLLLPCPDHNAGHDVLGLLPQQDYFSTCLISLLSSFPSWHCKFDSLTRTPTRVLTRTLSLVWVPAPRRSFSLPFLHSHNLHIPGCCCLLPQHSFHHTHVRYSSRFNTLIASSESIIRCRGWLQSCPRAAVAVSPLPC